MTVILRKLGSTYQFSDKRSSFHGWFRAVCLEQQGFGVTCSDSAEFQSWFFHEILHRRMCYISSEQREITKFDGICLPDGRVMKDLIEGEG